MAGLGTFQQPSAFTPSYLTSFELRLGDTTWLGLNGTLGYTAYEVPVTGNSVDVPSRKLQLNSSRIAVLVGVRQVIAEGLVDVSLFGAVGAAHESYSGEKLREGESVNLLYRPGSSADTLTIVGGLAVERELIEALALRLSVSLVSASLSRADASTASSGGEPIFTEVHTSRVGLSIAPSLQLHFYF